jgi:trans-aconitate methyltransferase
VTYVADDAAGYERSMGRWSRALAAQFVAELHLPAEGDILDAGCGTGALSEALSARQPALRILGVDPSASYVAAAGLALPLARFRTGDIQTLDLPDAGFDAALALLVLEFVPEPARALAELARVTRPGGLVAAAMWDFFGGFPFLRLFADTAAAMLPEAAAWRARHWANPIGSPGRLAELFAEADLAEIGEYDLHIRQNFANFEDWYSPWLLGQGFVGAFLVSLPAAQRARLEAALRLAWGPADGPRSFLATARMCQGRVRAVA